jgi:hypothetical protein
MRARTIALWPGANHRSSVSGSSTTCGTVSRKGSVLCFSPTVRSFGCGTKCGMSSSLA